MLKFSNKDTWLGSGVFKVNFEQFQHNVSSIDFVFELVNLNMYLCGGQMDVFIFDFEQVLLCWVFQGEETFSNSVYWVNIYLFKFNNGNTRIICEIFSKLTVKTLELRQWRRSGIFVVNFEMISHIVLVFPLLTLNN